MYGGRHGKRTYTLMIVPHASDGDVVSLRVPIFWLQLGSVFLVALWIGLLVFMNAYLDMVGHMEELVYLRAVNRQQRDQIVALTRQAGELAAELQELQELEHHVRSALGMEAAQGDQGPATQVRVANVPAGQALGAGLLDTAALFGVGGAEASDVTPAALQSDPALADLRQVAQTLFAVRVALPQQRDELEDVRSALAEEQARREATPSIWPTRGLVTSGFGRRRSPFGWGMQFHGGLDIAAPRGAPVVATAGGRVVFAGWDGAFGNTVVVDHGYGYRTLYAHNAYITVRVGDPVRRGQVIAYVGSTGRSTGPHLHYEVHVNGRRVNPWNYLRGGD